MVFVFFFVFFLHVFAAGVHLRWACSPKIYIVFFFSSEVAVPVVPWLIVLLVPQCLVPVILCVVAGATDVVYAVVLADVVLPLALVRVTVRVEPGVVPVLLVHCDVAEWGTPAWSAAKGGPAAPASHASRWHTSRWSGRCRSVLFIVPPFCVHVLP